VSLEDVEVELFRAALAMRQKLLEEASDVGSIPVHDSTTGQAGKLLEMIGQFLAIPGKFTPTRFQMLYNQVLRWIPFRTNPGDQDQRKLEKVLLLRLVSNADTNTHAELLRLLAPWALINLGSRWRAVER